MDGEFAGNQSCTGVGESRGKKSMVDGSWAQTCLPVDRTLVKDGNVWRRSGRKYDSGIICKSSHCKSPLTIKYLNTLYGQLDEQSMPVLRGAWNLWPLIQGYLYDKVTRKQWCLGEGGTANGNMCRKTVCIERFGSSGCNNRRSLCENNPKGCRLAAGTT